MVHDKLFRILGQRISRFLLKLFPLILAWLGRSTSWVMNASRGTWRLWCLSSVPRLNSMSRNHPLNSLQIQCSTSNFLCFVLWENNYSRELFWFLCRLSRYQSFKDFQKRILVATNLFGRGMDIERVNIVFNYDMPEDSDTYLHRVRLISKICLEFNVICSTVEIDRSYTWS